MSHTRKHLARTFPAGVRVVDGYPIPAGGSGNAAPPAAGDGGGGGGSDDGGGDGSGDGGGTGDGTGSGDGSGTGDGSGQGDGNGQPDLQQQALDAIQQLQQAGTQIPDALTAAVTQLKDARGDAANYRTKLRDVESEQQKTNETIKALRKALTQMSGQEDGDGEGSGTPNADDLQKQLTERDAALKTQTIELSAFKAAPKHEADPQALLDSRSFIDAAAKLDPDSDNFASELDSLVKSTVEANPKLKASQAPAKGGADHSGGTGDQAAKTLEDAVTARMGG